MIPIRLTQEYGGTYSNETVTRDVYANPERIVRFYADIWHSGEAKSAVIFGDSDDRPEFIRVLESPEQIALELLLNTRKVAAEQAEALQKVRVA